MVGVARAHEGELERIVFAVHGDDGGARVPRGALAEPPALVAPDSFKGTFSAREVAAAIAAGLRSAGREAEELPVADGGEGTMDALLVATLGGELQTISAADPLGRPVEASFALLDGRPGRSSRRRRRAGSGSWPRTSATPGRPRPAGPAS